MKWLCVIFFCLFGTMAIADDGPHAIALKPQPPSSKVTVVDGKRFYSLQNVRRFNGTVDSPKALNVMHYPRQEGVVTGPRNPGAPFSAVPSNSPLAATKTDGTDTPSANSDKLLSIFTPDDKTVSGASLTK